jgi:hypothetical protein
MKIYNIFRPHIIERMDGTFQIRKFIIPDGWRYLDLDEGRHWWSNGYQNYSAGTKEECEKTLLKRSKTSVKKVYTKGGDK